MITKINFLLNETQLEIQFQSYDQLQNLKNLYIIIYSQVNYTPRSSTVNLSNFVANKMIITLESNLRLNSSCFIQQELYFGAMLKQELTLCY